MPIDAGAVGEIRAVRVPRLWARRPRHDRLVVSQVLADERLEEGTATSLKQADDGSLKRFVLESGEGHMLLVSVGPPPKGALDQADAAIRVSDFRLSNGVVELIDPVWIKSRFWDQQPNADVVRESWSEKVSLRPEQRDEAGNVVREGLRNPQLGAIHAIAAHWSASERPALVVMPTGTGKTEVMMASIGYQGPHKTLLLVPSNALRTQTFDKFVTFGVLKRVGVIPQDAGFPIVAMIKGKLTPQAMGQLNEANCIVSTVSALLSWEPAALQLLLRNVELVIFDEAHHVPASSWNRLLELFAERRVLMFTATPFREDGRRIPGRIIYNYPLAKAQADGYFKPIHFKEVFEPDETLADEAIATEALKVLRSDLERGLNHCLLARVDRMTDAERLCTGVYQRLAPDLAPIVVHSGTPDTHKRLAAIRTGNHKVVVCVDMFGEGFDFPPLKIAALHTTHKSLAVTLQFTGRFTREAQGIGDATLVANIADPKLNDAIADLYAEDSNWNTIIPELSARAIQSEVDFSDFLAAMETSERASDDMFSLNILKPKTSTVIYEVGRFNPRHFRKGVRGSTVERVWTSQERDVLVFITKSRIPIEWATIKETSNEIWDLFVLSHDPDQGLLYIHSSQKGSFHLELARAVSGPSATLIGGERIFRALSGINRLVFHNVGLYSKGAKTRFRMFAGLDVGEAITPVLQAGAVKSNLFAVGYEDGKKVSVGASYKGRLWSMSSGAIPDWRRWCSFVARKVLDDSIATNGFLKHTLIPREVNSIPAKGIMGAVLPIEWFLPEAESLRLTRGVRSVNPHDVEIEDVKIETASSVLMLFRIEGEDEPVSLRLKWGPGEGDFSVRHESGPQFSIGAEGSEVPLPEFFREHPPSVLFLDGSELMGGTLLDATEAFPMTFDMGRITGWQWEGSNIRVESKWKNGQERRESIQHHLIAKLIEEDNAFVIDDDDAGEVADVVEIRERGSDLLLRLYHCKFSSGNEPAARAKDLSEVCAQAVRSTRWTANPSHLFQHFVHRELHVRNGRPTRFEKGTLRQLIGLSKRLQTLRLRYEVFVVQPGLSKAQLEAGLATVLAAASSYTGDITGSALQVISSP
jgi:superfamily II DNA or RNA helicase